MQFRLLNILRFNHRIWGVLGNTFFFIHLMLRICLQMKNTFCLCFQVGCIYITCNINLVCRLLLEKKKETKLKKTASIAGQQRVAWRDTMTDAGDPWGKTPDGCGEVRSW